MGCVTALSPAPRWAMLEAAGHWPFMRRAMIFQRLKCETIAFFADEELLAIAMLYQHRRWRIEFALALKRSAIPHMVRLVRHAHLTLSAIAQTGILVMARISPANEAGKRMARMVGFRPGRMRDPHVWLFKGSDHGQSR